MLGVDGGGGGRLYWGRKGGRGEVKGIAVVFGWVSVQEKQLDCHVDLYSSLGWNSLVSHADFLCAFYPERAFSLAFLLLSELVQELRVRPCPVVFVSLSGGSKACMYKAYQIMQEKCESHLSPDDSKLITNCFCGHIYDSSPLDFTSDLGVRFAFQPAIQRMPGPMKLVSWLAKGLGSTLHGLYLTRFDCQRTEYWQTLCSSIELGVPYLILCSDDDELAPYKIIRKFAQRLQDLGGDVKLVTCHGSPHAGHCERYPMQYRTAVISLLEKGATLYSHRIQRLEDSMHDEISEMICDLQKAAVNSNQSLRRVAAGPRDHFFVSSFGEDQNGSVSEPSQEERRDNTVLMYKPPSISAHSVLGQMLFDVCVPKNVEGWDIRFSGSLNGQPIASARRQSPLRCIKGIPRSRL